MPQATNSALMRIKNEKTILSLINKEPISRADIAKKTGLTKAAVTIIAEDLIKRGVITEKKSDTAAVGRTPLLLSIAENSVYFIGINIKRTGIAAGITEICGKVICERALPLCEPSKAYAMIAQTVEEMLAHSGIKRSDIHSAAVVTPGPVDTESGTVLNPPNFNKWHGEKVRDRLCGILGFDVITANVSRAVTVAEKYYGAAKGCENFITLLTDEGIGSGVMLRDKLFEGSCEIGHISIKYDGEMCECGNRGCLEKYASIPNILRGTKYKSWKQCAEDVNSDIPQKEAQYLSSAIITANNIFDLDAAILCGDLSESPQSFTDGIHKAVCGGMLLKRNFSVRTGSVKSQVLVASAIAADAYFN